MTRFDFQRFTTMSDKRLPKIEELKSKYKAAKLCKAIDTWFIEWYNVDPKNNKLSRVRKSFDLNREKDLSIRMAMAKEILTDLNSWLQNGWNYFDKEQKKENVQILTVLPKAFELSIANINANSAKTYTDIYLFFFNWVSANKPGMYANEFTKNVAVEFMKTKNSLSPSFYNTNIAVLGKVFKMLKNELGAIAENPFENMEYKKVIQTDRFEALTTEELEMMAEFLKANDEQLLCFTYFIIYSFSRPIHIKNLKRGNIDFERNIITKFGANSKTGRNSTKQLLKPLKDILTKLKVQEMNYNDYIFGPKYNAADKWKRYREKLGIEKKMYALRHTGAEIYLNNNKVVDLAWLQQMMEHKTLQETQNYIANRKQKMLVESEINLPKY